MMRVLKKHSRIKAKQRIKEKRSSNFRVSEPDVEDETKNPKTRKDFGS